GSLSWSRRRHGRRRRRGRTWRSRWGGRLGCRRRPGPDGGLPGVGLRGRWATTRRRATGRLGRRVGGGLVLPERAGRNGRLGTAFVVHRGPGAAVGRRLGAALGGRPGGGGCVSRCGGGWSRRDRGLG